MRLFPGVLLVWAVVFSADLSAQAASAGPALPFSHRGEAVVPVVRSYFVDSSGSLTFEQVRLSSFRDFPEQANFGYSTDIYYLRLQFPEGIPGDRFLEISYPQLDQVQVMSVAGEWIQIARYGDRYPFTKRIIPHRTFLHPLTASAPGAVLYVRFESTGSVVLRTRIVGPANLYQMLGVESVLFGMYYGIAAVMAFLYLFVYFSVRERSSLYYALHVIFQALFQLSFSGLAAQFLWPEFPEWGNISAPVFGALSLYFALHFAREFLELRTHFPPANTVLRYLGLLALFALPLLFSGYFLLGSQAVSGIAAVFTPSIFLVASVLWRKGYKPARLFLAGWSALLFGILFYALFLRGLVGASFLLEHSIQIGSTVQMLILALAITVRIGVLRREKEAAGLRALSSERRRRRLQEKMAYRLKRQVERRTAELSLANVKLLARDTEVRRELELAARIQRGLLPPETIELPGLRIATHCRYVTDVGGDYLDIFRFRGGPLGIGGSRVGILSADVSGHGIPAALVTSMAKICFQDAVRAHSSPKRVLIEVNRSLLDTVTAGSYLTAFYMTVDEKYGVRYCGGGHPDPLVYRASMRQIETWSAAGFLVGALPGMDDKFDERRATLAPGDRVLLYTDGLTEARVRTGGEFGLERLSAALFQSAELPLNAAMRSIISAFTECTDAADQEDDYSLVLVEADPSARPNRGDITQSNAARGNVTEDRERRGRGTASHFVPEDSL